MSYALLHLIHLLAAILFIGTWFAQCVVLQRARRVLEPSGQKALAGAWGRQTRRVLHLVVVFLYGAGLGLGWHYRSLLAEPLASRFALLLSLKVVLAVSLFLSFGAIAILVRRGAMSARRQRLLEWGVLAQMLGIVVLAKAMFYA